MKNMDGNYREAKFGRTSENTFLRVREPFNTGLAVAGGSEFFSQEKSDEGERFLLNKASISEGSSVPP